MAGIDTIIAEARTLATDYCDLKTFLFDESACFNADQAKDYPMLLVESRGIDKAPVGNTQGLLPKKKKYTLKFYFADEYNQEDINAGTLKESIYAAVERYADQYFAEFKTRILNDPTKRIMIESIKPGYVTDKAFNDCLIISVCDVDFTVESDCVLGQFSACP